MVSLLVFNLPDCSYLKIILSLKKFSNVGTWHRSNQSVSYCWFKFINFHSVYFPSRGYQKTFVLCWCGQCYTSQLLWGFLCIFSLTLPILHSFSLVFLFSNFLPSFLYFIPYFFCMLVDCLYFQTLIGLLFSCCCFLTNEFLPFISCS